MKLFFLFVLAIFTSTIFAQSKVIIGNVKDAHSQEPVLYASVTFTKTGNGKTTDSIGNFQFNIRRDVQDSLEISSIGYATKKYFIGSTDKDTIFLNIYLERAKAKETAKVTTKFNRGLSVWRRIVKNKEKNNRFKYNNFSYDLYNKLELDIVNLNKEKIKEIKLLKPFAFVLNNVDTTSELKPFLPIFLAETFSKYYLQNNPRKTREVISASRTSGIDNESVTKLLGGMYQNINFYNNFIPVFNTDFVSPFSENGDAYYTYKVVDTQFIGTNRCYKLTFTPKKNGNNTFVGESWIHDTTFAVVNINLTLDKSANINYVEKLTIFQEQKQMENKGWMIHKEKFIVNVAPVGKNNLTITGRKTTNYSNVITNDANVTIELAKNKTKEDIVLLPNATTKEEIFWQKERPELLSKNETSIYKLMDTLKTMPLFKRYSNTINFITTGTKYLGNVEIGPWYNWISGNSVEGTRVRFDLGTNRGFHKKLYLHGYLAYGFKDQKYKGKAEALYLFNKEPRTWIHASYRNDFDNGQVYYDEVSQDNIFALAIRKPNVPTKFLSVQEKSIEFFKEIGKGFSINTSLVHKKFTPIRNLPSINDFPVTNPKEAALTNFESTIKVRYAFLERFLEGNFYRVSSGSPRPIVEAKFSHGFSGVLKSAYNYNKLSVSISDYIKTPPYGSLYYNVFAGKIWGKLPYMLLEMHPGNEIFYYNKYAFNMMNRFEYISDQYAGINIEHNIGSGIFKYIPITRKMKIRQFWNAKTLWGKLNDQNIQYNLTTNSNFKTLKDQTYIEVGTGVDNILKVLRIDLVWRITQRDQAINTFQKFALFGSFRFSF